MSETLGYVSRRVPTAGDRYFTLLAIMLMGYALMGRGFAYIGFPPFYVGEVACLVGVLVFVRSGACIATFSTPPALLLVALMAWVVVRTVPYLDIYGFDALRDSVVILYGVFAFIVIGLLLEDARRIDTALRYYGIFVAVLPVMSIGYLATKYWVDSIPSLYGPNIPLLDIPATATGSHLAGAAVFVLIGYRRVSPIWIAIWLATFALVGATNRGAALAVLLPAVVAMLVQGRLRLLLTVIVSASAALAAVYVVEANFSHYQEAEDSNDRPVSAHQIVQNLESIWGQSGAQVQGTKEWRLEWWNVIIDDTFGGPHFWTGRGFGLNLAEADGYAGTPDPSNPRPLAPLRSPHNAHMTLLARTGVPGLVLWALMLVSWGVMMAKAIVVARTRGHGQWADLFLFIACYAAAILINATFDVVLEGPMQGIWFWCLLGFGVGSVMVYRSEVAAEDGSIE